MRAMQAQDLHANSHFTRLPHLIAASGRTSESRFATIHALTSVTVSSVNHRWHSPQTVVTFGERLNSPVGRNPKFTSNVGWSQFKQTPGADRQALFMAAHGMKPSSKPSQA